MSEKQKQVRIYVPKDMEAAFESLARDLGQSEGWLATTLFTGALRAALDAGPGLTLPLQLKAVPQSPRPKSKAA